MDEVANCPVCKNPRKSDGSGSLTQWIVTCECDLKALRESAQGLTSSLCARCGKRTRKALPGSISQFIFTSDSCSCSLEELQRYSGVTASAALLDKSDSESADEEPSFTDTADFEIEDSTTVTEDGQPGIANESELNRSAVLSSIQKSILEAAAVTPTESKPQTTRIFLIVGLVVLSVASIVGISMSTTLLRAPEHETSTLMKSTRPPDETLGERMRLYEGQKWTVLSKDGMQFYDVGPDNTDDDFELLNQYNDVRSIRCLRSEKITGAGFALIKNPRFGSLDFNSRELSDQGMECISRIKTIEILCLGWFDKVSESGMTKLESLPNLKYLKLNHARLPKNTLHSISKLTNLIELRIMISEKLNHNDLAELVTLPKLEKLELCALEISDADCVTLSRMTRLREIDLRNNKITDSGITQLARMPLLALDLSSNAIGDNALTSLSKIKSLKTLVIADCPKITAKAKLNFRKSLPGCQLSDTLSKEIN